MVVASEEQMQIPHFVRDDKLWMMTSVRLWVKRLNSGMLIPYGFKPCYSEFYV